ncbi:MAG: PhaP protein, partial [Caryophanon sp.]|nr:PhaP protein [Caryophanon sp.]
ASSAQLPAQPQFAQWFETVQQITEQTQQFAWKPNSIFADTLTQTQTQWNETVKSALEQQQEKREEVLTKIEELTVQLKDSQKRLLDSIPAVPGV